jgi:hypothetical protein
MPALPPLADWPPLAGVPPLEPLCVPPLAAFVPPLPVALAPPCEGAPPDCAPPELSLLHPTRTISAASESFPPLRNALTPWLTPLSYFIPGRSASKPAVPS